MTAALVELAALAGLAAAGWLLAGAVPGVLVPAAGRERDHWRLVLALPLGTAVFVAVELVLLATNLPIARPWIALGLALVLAVAAAARSGRMSARPVATRPVLVAVGLSAVVLLVTASVAVVNVSADSFRYLTMAELLAVDGDASRMLPTLLQTRSLAVAAVHGLAEPDPGYLTAFTPLVALSMLVTVWLVVREHVAALDATSAHWVAAGAVAVLATNHRVLFNALYVNSHMLFAVWMLLVVTVSWRVLRGAVPTGGDAIVAGLTVAGIAVLRPEGALVAGVALAPVLLAGAVARRWRQHVLLALATSVLLWHAAVVAPDFVRDGRDVSFSVLGMVVLGVALVVVATGLRIVDRWSGRRPLLVLHAAAWLAAAVLSVRSPGLAYYSALATAKNVLQDGLWGASLLVLAVLLVVAVVVRRVEGEAALVFPLATFVPLALLLAFLRDGLYRVGPGDSLNRMLLHVLPVAVVALAATAVSEPRRELGSRAGADGPRPERT